jgi:hypothetical protein
VSVSDKTIEHNPLRCCDRPLPPVLIVRTVTLGIAILVSRKTNKNFWEDLSFQCFRLNSEAARSFNTNY